MRRIMSSPSVLSLMSASCAGLAILMGGCPNTQTGEEINNQQQAANAAPTVSAGADQSVAGGAAVTLAATAADADGDALTFEWTQTGGPAVTLADETSAAASFTAPLTSGAMSFRVTVSDGQTSTSDTMTVTVSVAPMLFVSNYVPAGGAVLGFENPAQVNGNQAPDVNLSGGATQISSATDMVVDGAGALLVSNYFSNAIRCYTDATEVNGNFAPDRNVVGGATGLAGPTSMAIDLAADRLFVTNYAGAPDSIAIYDGASGAGFNGNLPPTRVITSADIANPASVNLDAAGNLYTVNYLGGAVIVFENAGALNGAVTASRVITSADFLGHPLFDVFVDSEDRLYALSTDGRVFMFDNASALNGIVSSSRTLVAPAAVLTSAIVVDSQGTAYIVDNGTSAIYSYDDVASLNGALPPDRTISGVTTQLATPIRLYMLER